MLQGSLHTVLFLLLFSCTATESCQFNSLTSWWKFWSVLSVKLLLREKMDVWACLHWSPTAVLVQNTYIVENEVKEITWEEEACDNVAFLYIIYAEVERCIYLFIIYSPLLWFEASLRSLMFEELMKWSLLFVWPLVTYSFINEGSSLNGIKIDFPCVLLWTQHCRRDHTVMIISSSRAAEGNVKMICHFTGVAT